LNCNEELKFIADENVFKLGRWLRILGYDVVYYSPSSDAELAGRALKEKRIILTRDNDFLEMEAVERCLLLESTNPVEQLKQVIDVFNLTPKEYKIFSRCMKCNTPIEPIEKAAVASKVPPYVYKKQEAFYCCPNCQSIYWPGSHTKNVKKKLKQFIIM
jgi:uncharacterized protein with PIN domain